VTPASTPLIEIAALSKNYHGLRPLRIETLTLGEGEHMAIVGLDRPMAETFINLVTGATLPDRGAVTIFGRPTSSIGDSAEWLATIDRFGIVSERAVLLEALSVIQNLAMPFTLQIEPPPDDVRERAAALAREVGLSENDWPRPIAELDASGRLRVRVGRALALDPKVLLLEHVSAGLPADAAVSIGSHLQKVAARRGCALIASRVFTLEPATGRLDERRRRPLQRLFGP
jgi:ABC-type lipoprotein export system ATPase subunit